MSDRAITEDLLARLQRHYIKPGDPMPGGMFMPEVALDGRRADALYVGFFQSRGRMLTGHEIKASRADWLHELDQPAKAEVWEPQCHSWYVVAPSTEIVRIEELPLGWGLMTPSRRTKTRMDILVKAALHPERNPSWEATHALVQKADSLRMASIATAQQKATEKARATIVEQVEARLRTDASSAIFSTNRADRAERLIAEVSDALGLRVLPDESTWVGNSAVRVGELASGFRAFIGSQVRQRETLTGRERDLDNAARIARSVADDIAKLKLAVAAQIEALTGTEERAS